VPTTGDVVSLARPDREQSLPSDAPYLWWDPWSTRNSGQMCCSLVAGWAWRTEPRVKMERPQRSEDERS
jgi:hypothetical protein